MLAQSLLFAVNESLPWLLKALSLCLLKDPLFWGMP